ncbi:nuclear transport factor 2 family protein [Candidatus Spongiisocius sp.]|uniref:nuclear transport factor 2 family protein n=1 Tax=Candidatus Spongiisocius sp. TaxID=3101273 RepID=UPI003B5C6C3D
MDVPTSPQTIVQHYFESINSRDWPALREVLHPHLSMQVVGRGRIDGVEAALAYFETLLAGFAEGTDRPTRFLVSGSSVVVEIDFDGRTVGGRPVAFSAVDVFDISDGKIKSLSVWYDSLDVARQVKGRQKRTEP